MTSLIIIGSSTGGIKTLKVLLENVTLQNSAIVLVQHHPPYVSSPFQAIMAETCSMPVNIASNGSTLRPATIWIIPGDFHGEIDISGHIQLHQGPKVCHVRPSVDVTLKSIDPKLAKRSLAAILTGMGRDGSEGVRTMVQRGGQALAQSPESSVIPSMPQNAINTGCIHEICSLSSLRVRFMAFDRTASL